jgi:predicted metalloendopeptidase
MRNLSVPLALATAFLAAEVALAIPASGQLNGASVQPGDDFYHYANDEWLRTTVLPARETTYGPTAQLKARNAGRVRELIQSAARSKLGGSLVGRGLRQRIGDYYETLADRSVIESAGLAPVAAELSAIGRISDRHDLSAALGRTLRLDDGSNSDTTDILGVWVHQSLDEPRHYLPQLVQGGLGLDAADAYLNPAKDNLRTRYRAHIAHVLALAGHSDAAAESDQVLALETSIARTHASRADTDDPIKTNNHLVRADFYRAAPGMDWRAYFSAAGLARQRDFLVWQPSALRGISALVASEPIAAWKAYLTFHLLDHYAAVLPARFHRLDDLPPSDPQGAAIEGTVAALGEAVGRLYAERYFPPRAKAAASTMAVNLRDAFAARIAGLRWMSSETRHTALAKLAALNIGVGYPDHWTDYTRLRIVRGDAYGNLRRAEQFEYRRALAKLGRPVEPAEWSSLTPQSVGAVIYFSPNTIQFSAGILQPPYFDPQGDAASNYGSAGAGMAHEISHSFDLLGNLYDERGRFRTWWGRRDFARYRAVTAPLALQYNAYCLQPGLCIDGMRVLNESVADLAGLRVAYDAYRSSLHGRPDRIIDGLTGDQRFFLAFARRWQIVQTNEALAHQVTDDIHAPGPYRSLVVRNVDAWYLAFGVKPGDRLYLRPADRVTIW